MDYSNTPSIVVVVVLVVVAAAAAAAAVSYDGLHTMFCGLVLVLSQLCDILGGCVTCFDK